MVTDDARSHDIPGGSVSQVLFESKIPPDEALRRFASGELVVARDMSHRLYAADYCVSEEELLDPAHPLHRAGMPEVVVQGLPGRYFCPQAVLAFLDSLLRTGTQPLMPSHAYPVA